MALLTAKSSTIYIGTSESTRVYHSVDEVPGPLRHRLQETTRSPSSATILIADRRGREELIRALQGETSDVQCRLAETMRARQLERNARQKQRIPHKTRKRWLDFLLPAAIGASLWLLVEAHF